MALAGVTPTDGAVSIGQALRVATRNQSDIDLTVTGGIAGYLFGIIFLQKVRWETRILQQEADREALRARIR